MGKGPKAVATLEYRDVGIVAPRIRTEAATLHATGRTAATGCHGHHRHTGGTQNHRRPSAGRQVANPVLEQRCLTRRYSTTSAGQIATGRDGLVAQASHYCSASLPPRFWSR